MLADALERTLQGQKCDLGPLLYGGCIDTPGVPLKMYSAGLWATPF